MEQLLGVNVETFDATDEASKVEMLKGIDATVSYGLTVKITSWERNFEANLVSVTAVLPVEEDNPGRSRMRCGAGEQSHEEIKTSRCVDNCEYSSGEGGGGE